MTRGIHMSSDAISTACCRNEYSMYQLSLQENSLYSPSRIYWRHYSPFPFNPCSARIDDASRDLFLVPCLVYVPGVGTTNRCNPITWFRIAHEFRLTTHFENPASWNLCSRNLVWNKWFKVCWINEHEFVLGNGIINSHLRNLWG